MESLEYSVAQEIADIQVGRPHVVILGAGASRATLPGGDPSGVRLPLMNDLVELCDLRGILASAGVSPDGNFEDIYSDLSERGDSTQLAAVRKRIDEYFSSLRLPERPTVYDALVLSLRPKDLIATFNWDPLLYLACWRNHNAATLPHVAYLHGNVAIGYCLEDRKKGAFGTRCSVCGSLYEPSELLYPIKRKGYSGDPYISREWNTLRTALQSAFMLTIFGYAAPESDVEALDIMSNAWGDVKDRNFEQTEIIDIKGDEEVRGRWSRFIHTHHYDIRSDFYDSWIALHPRRSCEAAWQQFFEAKFISTNPVPRPETLMELQAWLAPLLAAESGNEL